MRHGEHGGIPKLNTSDLQIAFMAAIILGYVQNGTYLKVDLIGTFTDSFALT